MLNIGERLTSILEIKKPGIPFHQKYDTHYLINRRHDNITPWTKAQVDMMIDLLGNTLQSLQNLIICNF